MVISGSYGGDTKDGSSDCVWTIKISKDNFRFFDTAKAAEAYYALTGTEKKLDSGWQLNENFGVNVVRPRGQGVVKFVI